MAVPPVKMEFIDEQRKLAEHYLNGMRDEQLTDTARDWWRKLYNDKIDQIDELLRLYREQEGI